MSLDSQIDAALAAPWWVLRFKPEMEAQFSRDTFRARIRHLMVTCAIGGFFVMFYLASDTLMIPDIIGQAIILRSIVNPVVVGLSLFAMSRSRSMAIAEAIIVTDGVLAILVVIYLTFETKSPYRDEYIAGAFLTMLYVNIVCQPRFGYAFVCTICNLSAIFAAVFLAGGIPAPVRLWLVQVNLTIALFTLGANLQIGRQVRRQYLLTLREQRRNEDLASNNVTLQSLSEEDPLTGVYNRRALDQRIHELFDRCRLEQSPINVIMIDVDHFKAYNDNFGHAMGDRCLQAIAAILVDETRGRSDLVARYGGEEFIIVLPRTDLARVAQIAERIRAAIETRAIPAPHPSDGDRPDYVTASFGIAVCTHKANRNDPSNPAALINLADKSLYAAKAAGRNRIYGA